MISLIKMLWASWTRREYWIVLDHNRWRTYHNKQDALKKAAEVNADVNRMFWSEEFGWCSQCEMEFSEIQERHRNGTLV